MTAPRPFRPPRVVVIDDVRHQRKLLSRDAALRHTQPRFGQLITDRLLDVGDVTAPQMTGRPDLGRIITDPEIDGRLGAAVDHQRVPTCPLELVAPPAARLSAANGARQRALGRDAVPPRSGEVRALQHPLAKISRFSGLRGPRRWSADSANARPPTSLM
jgi:hypothetical protein